MSSYIQGAIEVVLEDVLVSYISTWIENDQFKIRDMAVDTSEADFGPVTYGLASVHAGMLPKNEVGQVQVSTIPLFPFVLCHISHGKDMMPEGCVYTKIITGVWDNNADYQGYRDAVYLLRKIIRNIWFENTLGQNFQINMDEGTPWRVYDSNETTFPFFFAEATIGWRQRTPYLKAERDDLDATDIEPPMIGGSTASFSNN